MRCVPASNRPASGKRLLCAATMFLIAVASPGVAQNRVNLEARADGPIWGFQAREGASARHRPRLQIQYTTASAASADASWDVKTPVGLHSQPDTTSADPGDDNER